MRIPFQLALRNVLRQRRRTLSAVGALMLGVASIILAGGFVTDIFDHLAEATIRSQTGHIQVARAGFFSTGSRSPEKLLIAHPTDVARLLDNQAGVTDAMGRLQISGLLANGRADLAVVGEGVEPGKESRLGTYVSILQGRWLTDEDRFGIVVGEGVAQSLKLRAGDAVSLVVSTPQGAVNAIDFEVVGVSRSFSREYDARSVKLPLAAAQTLLDTDGINVFVVTVARTSDSAPVARALVPAVGPMHLDVRTWEELSDFYGKAVDLYGRQFGVLQAIVLLMVALIALNAINISTFERTHEFGTMRALGNRGFDIALLVLVETLMLGCIGSLLGVALGWVAAVVISAIGIPMPPVPNSNLGYVAQISFESETALRAFVTGVAASLVAAVPAMLRLSRMPIVAALRQGN